MTKNSLVLNKTIVANLSDAESNQIRGGSECCTSDPTNSSCDVYGSCFTFACGTIYTKSEDGPTYCCGSSYADCSRMNCK